jgi:xylan 1,4-beta-xylosidase
MSGRASTYTAVTAIVLSLVANASSAFVCSASGSASLYNATSKYLGCYLDPKVSILGQVKVSTIAMTPQYCANFCGVRGYAYGGVEFGT